MIIMQGKNAHEQYSNSLLRLWKQGSPVKVRGLETLELLDVATVIERPYDHCHFVPGRRWNPWVAMSEALWILAGRDDLACLLPYNKRMAEFSDDGVSLYGAYGKRIKEQIEPLLIRLRNDHSDRRGVLSIWREEDLWADTRDPCCNDLIMFKLRDNKLHMTVMNRSNDLHWGLYGVNLPTFGILQDYLAACLDVDMGMQTHISNSLHIYTGGPGMKENWRITERMLAASNQPLPEMPQHKRAFTEPVSIDALRGVCNQLLDRHADGQVNYTGKIGFLEFADDFLGFHNEPRLIDQCRHAEDYQDWVMAARIWQEESQDKFK